MNKYALYLLLAVTSSQANNNQDKVYNLLFVGNSLTYYNDLPNLVKNKARDRGITVNTNMLAYGNYAIVDHWADGEVQELIKSKVYDYVIIQQGPSSQPDGYEMLVNGGRLYSELCRAHGVKLAYYMVWPSRQYYHTFDGVIANYTAGAEANGAILLPVGAVWKAHFDATGDFSYYGPDQFHPSLPGSLVAAQVIVDTLFEPPAPEKQLQHAWVTGVGQIEQNRITVPELHVTEHGVFGAAYDPQAINKTSWGSMSITFDTCHSAQLSYTSHLSVDTHAFGSGVYRIQRLANNQPGSQCESIGFNEHQEKTFFSGHYYGGATRDGEGLSIDYLNPNQALVTWYTYLPSRSE